MERHGRRTLYKTLSRMRTTVGIIVTIILIIGIFVNLMWEPNNKK